MAPPERTSDCSSLLICQPRKDERLSWPCWLTCSGRFTHITGHSSDSGQAQDRESSLAKDWHSTTVPCHQYCYHFYSFASNRQQRHHVSSCPSCCSSVCCQSVHCPLSITPILLDTISLYLVDIFQ